MPIAHPQPKKNIYVMNIIIQNILEKIKCEGKRPQMNTQNLNAFKSLQKPNGGENPKSNLEGN
jgi:hypothetical protein